MDLLLKLCAAIIAFATALLNFITGISKFNKKTTMSESKFAIIAIVIVCLIVTIAISRLVNKG